MVRIAPTAAQQPVLEAIRTYWAEYGYAPGVRDIAGMVGHSLSTVQYHLDNLKARGWIERDPNVARSIRLNRQGEQTPYVTEQPCTQHP